MPKKKRGNKMKTANKTSKGSERRWKK